MITAMWILLYCAVGAIIASGGVNWKASITILCLFLWFPALCWLVILLWFYPKSAILVWERKVA